MKKKKFNVSVGDLWDFLNPNWRLCGSTPQIFLITKVYKNNNVDMLLVYDHQVVSKDCFITNFDLSYSYDLGYCTKV